MEERESGNELVDTGAATFIGVGVAELRGDDSAESRIVHDGAEVLHDLVLDLHQVLHIFGRIADVHQTQWANLKRP